jgi:mRNA interferase MazF
MIRGDLYLAVLDPSQGSEQAGTRPVIVITRDAINKQSPVVVVVPLAGRINRLRLLSSHVEIKMGEGGLTVDSVALCEQVRAVSTTRLTRPLGHLSEDTISQLNSALKIALDLP